MVKTAKRKSHLPPLKIYKQIVFNISKWPFLHFKDGKMSVTLTALAISVTGYKYSNFLISGIECITKKKLQIFFYSIFNTLLRLIE